MICPRRDEVPALPFQENEDQWRENGTCSFCGSMCPGTFMDDIKAGAELGPTDKSYKVYMPNGKFYFQHLSPEQQQEFVQLLNTKQLKIGMPGHFYVLPFFIQRKTDK